MALNFPSTLILPWSTSRPSQTAVSCLISWGFSWDQKPCKDEWPKGAGKKKHLRAQEHALEGQILAETFFTLAAHQPHDGASP